MFRGRGATSLSDYVTSYDVYYVNYCLDGPNGMHQGRSATPSSRKVDQQEKEKKPPFGGFLICENFAAGTKKNQHDLKRKGKQRYFLWGSAVKINNFGSVQKLILKSYGFATGKVSHIRQLFF